MNHVCREITDYVRACEHLLCKEGTLTDDERGLLEYYVKELSRELLGSSSQVYSTLERGKEAGAVQKSSSVNRVS